MQFCNNKVNMAHSAIKMVGNHAFFEKKILYSKKEMYIKRKKPTWDLALPILKVVLQKF